MELQTGISEWVQSEVTCNNNFSASAERFRVGRSVEVYHKHFKSRCRVTKCARGMPTPKVKPVLLR